jgi:hypothetical protein
LFHTNKLIDWLTRESTAITLTSEQVLYKEGESNVIPGLFIILSGEIGVHTANAGVFSKITEHTLGEECIIGKARNFKGKFLETAFCLSYQAILLFLSAEKFSFLKEETIKNKLNKDYTIFENCMERSFLLKQVLRNGMKARD